MSRRLPFVAFLLSAAAAAVAAPLPERAVPDPLRTWIPWVMHGHETVACPFAHDDGAERACAWPSELDLDLRARGGAFTLRVEVFADATPVVLPGDAESWPQQVQSGGSALAVTELDGRPRVLLRAGRHLLTGRFAWTAIPQSLGLPPAVGVLRANLDGRRVGTRPDDQGRLWLRQEDAAPAPDAMSLQVFRLVDDGVPMTVTTRFDIAAAGQPRELVLPAALLPGFIPLALDSALPARLADDGRLRVKLRPGNWSVTVSGRRMEPVGELVLPPETAAPEELWSFRARNEVRLVAVEGAASVDPKQSAMPEAWKAYPAWRLAPGTTLRFNVLRRGEDEAAPDKLVLARRAWLDFDGQGYTLQDSISGEISRSWRLEVAPPVVLGRVAVDGADQPVTRMGEGAPYGIEVRQGHARISADSRVEGETDRLPATWRADFSNVSTVLNLPPGWRLLHAGGVDRADGTWLAAWNLWDFFFVLLTALVAGRLFGAVAGVVFALALTLSWHLSGAPDALWPLLLALIAIERALQPGRLRTLATFARRGALVLLALVVLPFAVGQLRQALHPSLEHAGFAFGPTMAPPQPAAAPAPAAPEAFSDGAADAEYPRRRAESAASVLSKSLPYGGARQSNDFAAIDPAARVQTGPGLPGWQWRSHRLLWQGPVAQDQEIDLWLLPPAATAGLNVAVVVLLGAALWIAAGRPRRIPLGRAAREGVLGLGLALGLAGLPGGDVAAAAPADASVAAPVAEAMTVPAPGVLNELREKLTVPADCLPNCASLSRLHLAADQLAVRLRLEIHAAAPTMVPLPGTADHFRPERVSVSGAPASLRRDDEGGLWTTVPAGVSDILMEAAAGNGGTVQIALPLPPRELGATLSGWTLGGLDARGLASGALTLSREQPQASAEDGGGGQTLPPFVRIVRNLRLAERWTVETTATRVGPGAAPAQIRVPLLEDEAVNDPAVRVEDGYAVVTLAQAEETRFASTLRERAKLVLAASREANQVEVWQLDADPRWHVSLGGIAPIHQQQGERWLPLWQPWPGETAEITVSRPQGVDGQTLTLDGLRLALTPGRRATEASAQLQLRSSQGGNHTLQVPEGAELLAVAIDGQTQPIRAQGRAVTIPLQPGAHQVKVDWREARGMGTHFVTSSFEPQASGANAAIELRVPDDRWVLAVGGPLLGPAVLFWGVLPVLAAVAWALGRSRIAPLGTLAWFLLALGLAQASMAAAAIVAGWFLVLDARRRFGPQMSRRRFNLVQIGLALWTIAALSALLEAIRAGLLGSPDMLISGNGSSAFHLAWYQDRIDGTVPVAWAVSLPLYVYRIAMLLWALWLARALLDWVRWGWGCFTADGYWRPRPAGDGGSWRKRRPQQERSPAAVEETAL